jgi:predicted ATPase
VFFVGENGSGKSTLLEAIARRCGINFWDKPRRHLAHNNPFEAALSQYISPLRANGRPSGSFFRAETFREVADFLDDVALCDPGRLRYHGGRILNDLSHGEGILSYFRGRFGVQGLYFLDEPEAALSPRSQIEFLQLLQQYTFQKEAQFIIATHSPLLMACPEAQIFCFRQTGIEEIAYEETMHYRLYKSFLADRTPFLAAQTEEETM